jgi:hypothetical protein
VRRSPAGDSAAMGAEVRDAEGWHTALSRINTRMERVGEGFGRWVQEQGRRAREVDERLLALEEGGGAGGALEQRLAAMQAEIDELRDAAGGGSSPQSVDIVCPEGCSEGEAIIVEVLGRQLEIEVPAGVGAGETFSVQPPPAAAPATVEDVDAVSQEVGVMGEQLQSLEREAARFAEVRRLAALT